MHLQESGEMYLETIYRLTKAMGTVRSLDVAEYMGFSKPSISRAVSLLKSGGYITVDANGHLLLTDTGKQIAESMFERHTILTRCLVLLGVDETIAEEDACKIEHHLSETSFAAIKKFVENQ